MRLRFLLPIVNLLSGALSAGEPGPPFAPLQFLIGHCWQAKLENGQRDIQCFEPIYAGKHIRNTQMVLGGTGPRSEGMTIFSQDSSANRIRFHNFTSTGAVSSGELIAEVDGYRIPERHVDENGAVAELETRLARDGEYGYLVQTRVKTGAGWKEKRTLHYRRSDAPDAAKEIAAQSRPDGEWRLAWTSSRDGNWEIYRQEADGRQVNLTRRASSEWLWNSHATELTVLSTERRDGESKGWRGYRMQGGVLTRIGDEVVGDGYVDCHPDGKRCLADQRIDGKRRIAIFSADGKRVGLLANPTPGAEDADPHFSADGRKLLFRSNRSGSWELWLADADGSNAKAITADPSNDSVAAHEYGGEGPARFSPDGRRIVWMRKFPDHSYDIWTMSTDGSELMNLTRHHPSSDAYPSFSPDGQRIAFDSDRDGNNEIYTMALDGTDVRRITLSPGNDLAPMWVRVAKETTK